MDFGDNIIAYSIRTNPWLLLTLTYTAYAFQGTKLCSNLALLLQSRSGTTLCVLLLPKSS